MPGGDELVELCATGQLVDGTAFTACDCIRVVPPDDGGADAAPGGSPETPLARIISQWGVQDSPADADGDGTVGLSDLLALLPAF